MYSEICEFAKKKKLSIPNFDRNIKKINGYILLDKIGNYVGFEKLDKPISKIVLVHRNDKKANVLCEKIEIIFNLQDEDLEKANENINKKHFQWVDYMESGKEYSQELNAIATFVSRCEEEKSFFNQVKADLIDAKAKGFLSFMIDGVCIEDNVDAWGEWFTWFRKNIVISKEASNTLLSSISGDRQKTCPATSGPICHLFGNNKISVASASHNSYCSYGFSKADTLQVGIDDVNRFAAAINYFDDNKENQDRNFGIVFFYENDKDIENLIYESLNGMDLNDESDIEEATEEILNKIKNNRTLLYQILNSARTGVLPQIPQNLEDIRYYIYKANISGSATDQRMSLNRLSGTYKDLVNNLAKWYKDTALIEYGEINFITKAYNILLGSSSVATSKNFEFKRLCEKTNQEFGQQALPILFSIYKVNQIPVSIYHAALHHAINSVVAGYDFKESIDTIKIHRTLWLRIIKCYLIRKGYNIMYDLTQNVSPAYACGRLFALYEKEQEYYNGLDSKKKPTLSRDYFSGALNNPEAMFPLLAQLETAYKTKMQEKYPCAIVSMDKLKGEIAKQIGSAFPKRFTKEEKGAFILGYYQQSEAFYTKKNDNVTDNVTDGKNKNNDNEKGE